MDDIKESVRVAAGKTAEALSRVSIKMCDAGAGARAGEAAVRTILPPLVERGLSSSLVEVRAVVLLTLQKVAKSAGPLLAPHLGTLIPALLEATGEMEGSKINYISSRLATDSGVQERLDSARLAASRSSPPMECVIYVLQFVSSLSLGTLVPRLVDIIKSGVALVTRGGAAYVVTALTHQCPLDLQPFTGKLLSAFVTGLSDRNPAIRLAFAGSIGHLMRTAKDSSKEKLFTKLRSWYMEREDEASRAAVAWTFQAVNRHNPDVMKAMASSAMPVAFLAMHEERTPESTEVLEVWEEVWQEGTPGSEGGIRLYLSELMEVLPQALESAQWSVKAQAARWVPCGCSL
jgi:proteasome component ECM29